ncbi:hypothetical protein NDU88_001209 [Pleurodeles waltl]|uniref:Uncharacterized protein n=1 Tax=Pleurodeles waltl TaxID=8319 RepID=A0AAV7M2G5_PLEWA|nr:hypothetical protein NDU88_001209 [Pleurodeles waltl]
MKNDNYIYMYNVPSSPIKLREDKFSLMNKVLHWLRHVRGCGSIIHADILSAKRLSGPTGDRDTIKLNLTNPHLVTGLLHMGARNHMRKKTAIFLSDSCPVAGNMRPNLPPNTAILVPSSGAGHYASNGLTPGPATTNDMGSAPNVHITGELDLQGATSDID